MNEIHLIKHLFNNFFGIIIIIIIISLEYLIEMNQIQLTIFITFNTKFVLLMNIILQQNSFIFGRLRINNL